MSTVTLKEIIETLKYVKAEIIKRQIKEQKEKAS